MASWFDARESDFNEKFAAFLENRGADFAPVSAAVSEVLAQVKQRGDKALLEYTQKWDQLAVADAKELRIAPEAIERAYEECDIELREALELSAQRIARYHAMQMPEDQFFDDGEGNQLGWQYRPLQSVGVYVPGGRAVYPSSVLMSAVPARTAGVERVVMVVPTPKGELNPILLTAAKIAGVEEIYTIGGAQAVGALAYGTETIAPANKIVGPGNAYVAEAKRQLFGTVGIDSVAGPSEICVVADRKNNPKWIAADLLSQAEHGEESQAILIADDQEFAGSVCAAIEQLLTELPRSEKARKSWEDYGAVVMVESVNHCKTIIDIIAPEHLELAIEEPELLAETLSHASAIFLGRHTPEAFGDYVAGPSHVLPTGGTARFSSGLSVFDFLNRHSLIKASSEGIHKPGRAGHLVAQSEGLDAHALSLACRLSDDD
jgi:histidinol dehydrogenase